MFLIFGFLSLELYLSFGEIEEDRGGMIGIKGFVFMKDFWCLGGKVGYSLGEG